MAASNEQMGTLEIVVPGDKIGCVIGSGGSTIKAMKRRTGVAWAELDSTSGCLQVRCTRAAEASLLDLLGSLLATKRVRPLLALSLFGRSLKQKNDIRLVPATSSRTRLPPGIPGCGLYAPVGRGSCPPASLSNDPQHAAAWNPRNNRCGFIPPGSAASAILRAQLQKALQDVRISWSAGSFRFYFSGGAQVFASEPANVDASSWFSPCDGASHLSKGVPFFSSQLFGDAAVVQGLLESQGFELGDEEDTLVLHFVDVRRGFRFYCVDLVEDCSGSLGLGAFTDERRSPQKLAAVRRVLGATGPAELLGLSTRHTPADVQTAYKELSKTLHPDKNLHEGATLAFKRLGDAKDILINEERRQLMAGSVVGVGEAEPFLLRPVADVVKLVAICVLQSAVEGSPMGGRLVLQAGVPLEELSPVVVREVKRAWAERQQTEGLPVLGDSLRATCARRVCRKTFSKGNAALARKWGEVQVCLSRVRERVGSEVKSKEHLEIFVSCPPLLRRVESFARGDRHEDPADLADAMVQFMFAAEEIIASACDVGST